MNIGSPQCEQVRVLIKIGTVPLPRKGEGITPSVADMPRRVVITEYARSASAPLFRFAHVIRGSSEGEGARLGRIGRTPDGIERKLASSRTGGAIPIYLSSR